ncbi:MAG: hypothetical protein J6Z82_07960 [Schwartzia sp.]|nr:hypothetical protein [Schwartzia sp. (in: firmicutes)]
MPDNILYGVFKENSADAEKSKCIECFKSREKARRSIIGYNSINKDKNVFYCGKIVQWSPGKSWGRSMKASSRNNPFGNPEVFRQFWKPCFAIV